jgi:streptogramin lyase
LTFWRTSRNRRTRNQEAERNAPAAYWRRPGLEQLEDRTLFSANPFNDVLSQLPDNLNALQGQVDNVLNQVTGLTNGLKGLPFLGDTNLGGLPALRDFIHKDVEGPVHDALQQLANLTGSPSDDQIRSVFFSKLGGSLLADTNPADGDAPNPVTSNDVVVTHPATLGPAGLEVAMHLHEDLGNVQPNFSIGLPGIPLQVNGSVNVHLAFDYLFTFRYDGSVVSFDSGALLSDHDPTQPHHALAITLDATLGPGFSAQGTLGFFQVTCTDGGDPSSADPTKHTEFNATLGVDGLDNPQSYSLDGNADVNLHVQTSIGGSTAYPSVGSDFHLHWGFGANAYDPLSPSVSFDGAKLDLGSYISSVVAPIVQNVQSVLDPIQPLLDTITARIPGLSDLTDAVGMGDVTLLSLAEKAAGLSGDPEIIALVNLANTLTEVSNLVGAFESSPTGNLTVNLGGFNLGSDDLRHLPAADPNLGDPNLTSLTAVATGDAQDVFADPSQITGNAKVQQIVQDLKNDGDTSTAGGRFGFDFPILDDPAGCVFKLLLGEDADLASFSADFKIDTGQVNFLTIPIFAIFDANISGELSVSGHFRIGYDTRGLRELLQPQGASGIADGLYLDPTSNVSVTATIQAGVGVDVPFVHADLYGKISANATVSTNSNDKVRLTSLPDDVFNTSGAITAGLGIHVEVGFSAFGTFIGYEKDFNLATVTLVDLTSGHSAKMPDAPVLGNVDPATGELTLNTAMGNDEHFTISHVHDDSDGIGGETVDVTYDTGGAFSSTSMPTGARAHFDHVTKITAVGMPEQNLSIDVGPTVTSEADLTGGSGNTTFSYLGSGTANLVGGGGNNTLRGGSGGSNFNTSSSVETNTIVLGSGDNSVATGVHGSTSISYQAPQTPGNQLISIDSDPAAKGTYLNLLSNGSDDSFTVSDTGSGIGIDVAQRLGTGLFAHFDLTGPFASIGLNGAGGASVYTVNDLSHLGGTASVGKINVSPRDPDEPLDPSEGPSTIVVSGGQLDNIDVTGVYDGYAGGATGHLDISQANVVDVQVVDSVPADTLVLQLPDAAPNTKNSVDFTEDSFPAQLNVEVDGGAGENDLTGKVDQQNSTLRFRGQSGSTNDVNLTYVGSTGSGYFDGGDKSSTNVTLRGFGNVTFVRNAALTVIGAQGLDLGELSDGLDGTIGGDNVLYEIATTKSLTLQTLYDFASTIHVSATAVPTTIDLQFIDGDSSDKYHDMVVIGDSNHQVQAIRGNLVIEDPNNHAEVIIDAGEDGTPAAVSFSQVDAGSLDLPSAAPGTFTSITGLAPGSITYEDGATSQGSNGPIGSGVIKLTVTYPVFLTSGSLVFDYGNDTRGVTVHDLTWQLEIANDPAATQINISGDVFLNAGAEKKLLAETPNPQDQFALIDNDNTPVPLTGTTFSTFNLADITSGMVAAGGNRYQLAYNVDAKGSTEGPNGDGDAGDMVLTRIASPTITSLSIGSPLTESGLPATLTGTVADASIGQTANLTIDWGDGSPVDPPFPITHGNASFSFQHPYTEEKQGPYTVTVTYDDGTVGGQTVAKLQVVVHDAPLTLIPYTSNLGAPSALSAVEGRYQPDYFNGVQGFHLGDLFAQGSGDEGSNDYTVLIDWGEPNVAIDHGGALVFNHDNGSFQVVAQHAYQEEGSYTVHVTVTDDGGSSASMTVPIEVKDADVGTVNGYGQADPVEGQLFDAPIALFTDNDPNGVPTDYVATIDWGESGPLGIGTVTPYASYPNGSQFTISASHTFTEAGIHGITVTIQDVGGASTPAPKGPNFYLFVQDAPLTVTAVPIDEMEGQAFTTTVAYFTDSDPRGTSSDYSASISWGDDPKVQPGIVTAVAPGLFRVIGTHTYSSSAARTLQVLISDEGNYYSSQGVLSSTIDAPLAAAGMATLTPTEGSAFSGLVATFTDADQSAAASKYSATIVWGDTSVSLPRDVQIGGTSTTGFTVSATHTYTDEGPHVIQTVIFDLSGGQFAVATTFVQVGDAAIGNAVMLLKTATEGVPSVKPVASFTDQNLDALASDFTAVIKWSDPNKGSAHRQTGTPGKIVRATDRNHLPIRGQFLVYDEGGPDSPEENVRPYSVEVDIGDVGGKTTRTKAAPVLVADAPLSAQSKSVSGLQGLITSGYVATFTDPDTNDLPVDYTASINWGDGSATSAGSVSGSDGNFQVAGSHIYTDGRTYTVTVTIHDHLQSVPVQSSAMIKDITQAPQVNPKFHVAAGNSQTIGLNDLSAVDDDPHETGVESFIYQVMALPTLGELDLDGNALHLNDTFSQLQINLGQLEYVSHGMDGTDSFGFSLTDDLGSLPFPGTFTIQVDDVPSLTVNTLDLTGSKATPITVATLRATDDNSDPDTELKFVVVTPPGSGQLVLTRPSQAGKVLRANSSFTQDDVDKGNLSYVPGSKAKYDSFRFTVQDGSSPASLSSALAIVSDPPLTATSPFTLAASEDLAFTGTVTGFTDADTTTTSASYSAVIDWGDGGIGKGTVSANGLGGFRIGGTHTYLAAGSFTVKVYVQDSGGASVVATGTANVTDRPVLTVNTGLTLLVGTEESINDNMLLATDLNASDPPSDLIYTLTAVPDPTVGNLQLNGKVLAVGDTFTQFNVQQGLLGYQDLHPADSDGFSFTVQDGTAGGSASGTFAVSIGGSPGFSEVSASSPYGIVTGPDGDLWFTEYASSKIGRYNPNDGTLHEYSLLTPHARPEGITVGPDGALWFTENTVNQIGRISVSDGTVQEFQLPTGATGPAGIATGSDGQLWFTYFEFSDVGHFGTFDPKSGTAAIHSLPGTKPEALGITAGPDGNIWITEFGHQSVSQITKDYHVTEYPIPGADQELGAITAGPDGALWFTESIGNAIGRITTDGAFTRYSLLTLPYVPIGGAGGPNFAGATQITTGADGNLYFTEYYANRIGRMTPAGNLTEIALPTAASHSYGITAGPDGNIWFGERDGGKIGQLTLPISDGLSPIRSAAGTPVSVAEGASFSGTVATFVPLKPTASAGSFSATIAWGDGSTGVGTINEHADGTFALTGTHGYTEGGNFLVSTQIMAADNSVFQTLAQATVTDAVLAGMAHNASVASGLVLNQTLASFTDTDLTGSASDYGALIRWDDGFISAGTIKFNAKTKQYDVTGTHAFASAGKHSASVIVVDAGGGKCTVTSQVRTG